MNDVLTELQPDLWPGWVAKHPWLISLLAKAEAEARNRGDTNCDHFHIELAFLSLGPPVRDWLETLGLDARLLREDVVEILGMNAKADVGKPKLEAFLERGQRARAARSSSNPVAEFPLASVDEVYTDELLALARAEAGLHGDCIDERHFLIALAMLLFEGSPPPASALRYLAGLSQREDTSYGARTDDQGSWIRDLAESHGADRTMFPYDIGAPRG